ncbi:DUF1905 domain-containing protein [Pedobacter cryophilus]|uniref:DUF1905 domain-containing protein n=1 Tax=Pedobacter cryophilus TaxID=2571271 RepID=A0A4U1BXM6_9SPHI|nr:DUF1905 domain-containing protein [Pedobacter cryophilus]TKB97782.1 DUF1905 domain-containing protein [Pedobacter cryophilus]
MNYIVKDEKLVIQYIPGNGAWTYQLIIPNTKNIKGKWGDLKVSGTIDNYIIKNKNLGPVKNADKKLSLNADLRNSINKGAGEIVTVTLFLENQNNVKDLSMIMECFKDAEVLAVFKKLEIEDQNEILKSITNSATEDQEVEKILKAIERLQKLK